jgi:hypothetical protein
MTNAAATYDDPSSSPKDAVRFWIGDTDMRDALLSDAEVRYCLNTNGGSVLMAAKSALINLSAKFSLYTQESVGPVSVANNSIAQQLQKQLAIVIREIAITASIENGATYVAEKRANERDPAIVHPAFTRKTLMPRSDEDDYGAANSSGIAVEGDGVLSIEDVE